MFSDFDQSAIGPILLWVHDGRMIFALAQASGDVVKNWEITTDPQTGKPSGKPTEVANSGEQSFAVSVSRDGRRLVVSKDHSREDVYVGELKENGNRMDSPTRLTVSESSDHVSAWTRDSKAILFDSDRTGKRQIFRQQLDQDSAQPLIQGPDNVRNAELSPDGAWILYWLSPPPSGNSSSTTSRLMRFPVAGGSPEQLLETAMDAPTDFHCSSRPGGSCIVSHWEQGQLIFYSVDPVKGRGDSIARTKMEMPRMMAWCVSRDGSRIAVSGTDQLNGQFRILDLRNAAERNIQFPHDWLIWNQSWSADGNALFATAQSKSGYFIARIDLDGKTRVLLNRGRNQWLGFPRPSPDGKRFAFSQLTFQVNAWLLENF